MANPGTILDMTSRDPAIIQLQKIIDGYVVAQDAKSAASIRYVFEERVKEMKRVGITLQTTKAAWEAEPEGSPEQKDIAKQYKDFFMEMNDRCAQYKKPPIYLFTHGVEAAKWICETCYKYDYTTKLNAVSVACKIYAGFSQTDKTNFKNPKATVESLRWMRCELAKIGDEEIVDVQVNEKADVLKQVKMAIGELNHRVIPLFDREPAQPQNAAERTSKTGLFGRLMGAFGLGVGS